jgi:hypothetical protein
MFDPNDPLKELFSAPRQPMTPAQIESYRPKPATASNIDEAKAIAYKTGIKELEPLIRRIIALEEKVAALQSAVLVQV